MSKEYPYMCVWKVLNFSGASISEYFEILKSTLRLLAWFIHKDSKLFPAFKVSIAFKDKNSKVKYMKVPVKGATLRGKKSWRIKKWDIWGCGVDDLYRYFYNLATYGDLICNAFSIRLGHHLASTCTVFKGNPPLELALKRGVGVFSCLGIQSSASLSV